MRLFRRKTEADAAHGVIVHDGNDDHRCRPPGCYEWPAGEWKINNTRKYPEGTVWRCPCGDAWRAGRYPPGFGGQSYSLGMWSNWYRDYANDAEVPDA